MGTIAAYYVMIQDMGKEDVGCPVSNTTAYDQWLMTDLWDFVISVCKLCFAITLLHRHEELKSCQINAFATPGNQSWNWFIVLCSEKCRSFLYVGKDFLGFKALGYEPHLKAPSLKTKGEGNNSTSGTLTRGTPRTHHFSRHCQVECLGWCFCCFDSNWPDASYLSLTHHSLTHSHSLTRLWRMCATYTVSKLFNCLSDIVTLRFLHRYVNRDPFCKWKQTKDSLFAHMSTVLHKRVNETPSLSEPNAATEAQRLV